MILDEIFKKKNYYVYVSEGKHGLETQVSDELSSISKAHRDQLISFFEGVIEDLKGKK